MTQLRATSRLCKKAAFSRGRALSGSVGVARRSQRGILHVLFLVFAIMGVSLWGISEFLLSAEKESRGITAESAAAVTETKRILLNYVLNPPPHVVDDVPHCGLNSAQGCYNYYAPALPAYAKDNHATFSLPCPDLATDGNLDGASDPGAAGCGASIAGALESEAVMLGGREVTLNHRFGRIPWRDERLDSLYVRGLGNRDLRDGAAARLWYGISRNLAPCVVNDPDDAACPFLPDSEARNGHALLALEDGWLTVVTRDDNGNEVILSDRVAAVVISPGSGADGQTRPDEDAIFSGAGDDNQNLSTLAVAANYLEGENADGDDVFFAYGQYGISLRIGADADRQASPTRHSEDHLEYLTIDELVAAAARGRGDIDPAADVAELLEGYRRRFGYYPDPAVLRADSGEGRSRPAGVLMRAAVGGENIPNIRIAIADLPPVYLAPGWRFPEREGHFDSRPSFPFNESLAKMNTRFADTPLREMAGGTNYQNSYSLRGHVVNEKDIYGLSALTLAEADTGVSAPEFDFVARSPEIQAERGATFRVILAAPLALNTTMTAIVEIPDGETVPPGGADVILPAGTELELQAGSETFVQFPAGLQIRGRRYRSALAAEILREEDIRRRFPEIGIPLEVNNPVFASDSVGDPLAFFLIDGNGRERNVGSNQGWLRPVAPDGTQSRYEIRPEFEMRGPIPNNVALSFEETTGFLNSDMRGFGNSFIGNATLAHQPHRMELTGITVRDHGGFAGNGILPGNLRAQIFIKEPKAFHWPGNDLTTDYSVGAEMNNGHLHHYFSDVGRNVRDENALYDGVLEDGGAGLTIYFDNMPFSRIVRYNIGGAFPECDPCPYSGGFFAEKLIVSLDVDLAKAVSDTEDGEVAGVELTEQTYLPARLVDRSADGVVNLSKAVPSGLPVVSGPMGFAPVMRAGAVMDSAFFEQRNLSALNSFHQGNGNAVARLYFALTVAGRGALAFTPFPPPGRPAISGSFTGVGGVDTTVEDGLRPLPGMVEIPAGAAVGMPAGTRIILPELAAKLDLGRGFTFPDKAFAIMPPGSSAMASVVAGQVRPDGTEVAAGAGGLETLAFPQGGVLELSGARFLAGGGQFDELVELEIRGRVDALEDGGVQTLNDGAIVQPFTGRSISPNRMALADGAEIVGDTRVRARFTRRPLMAPRPGEPLEPAFPLMITGAVAASQKFPAGVFSNLNTGASGEVNLTFDEDTEFLLPAGWTLTIDEGIWDSSGESYGAVELGDSTNFYNFEPGSSREDVVLSLTLPAGTRVYDKRFGADPLQALSSFSTPLAADLGNPGSTVLGAAGAGQARFNFALFPESNLLLRAPGAGGDVSIPGGAVVDVGGRAIIPPAGVMRIPRVAGDLEVVSNGEMMIYVGGGGRLELEYEYAEVVRRGDRPHADGDRVAVPYREVSGRTRGAQGALTPTAPDGGNAKMLLPEGALILIPPGDPLPLHANYLMTTANAISHIRLPQDAVMVLRAGMQASFGGSAVTGPAYVRLGGMAENGRPAAANLILDRGGVSSSGESFVMLREGAQLRARPGARVDAPAVHIPAHARLDLYGNMEVRGEPWFFNEALPARATELLKNTPMIYAVAPECRRLAEDGKKCGDESAEGLTFQIPPGEEILLSKDTPAPERFRVEAGDGGEFSAALYALNDLSNPPTALKTSQDASYVRVGVFGRIFTDGTGFSVGDFLNSSLDSGRKYMVLTPPASGFRVYLGLGEAPSDADREAANYVEVLGRPLTIYNGGYVGDTYTEPNNLGLVVLDPGEDFTFGAGSRIFDGGMRPGAFGAGSSAPAGAVRFGTDPTAPRTTAPLDLTDYVAVNNGVNSRDFFNFEADLGAQIAKVDALGRVEYRLGAGDLVGAGPGPASEFNRSRAYQITADADKVLQLAMGQTLQMEPGYLWQGYIPAGGVEIDFTRSDNLHNAYWPPSPESPKEALLQSRLLLRMHPSDLALNFFGSGVETVEGLDGEAEQVPARELLAMSEALFRDFAVGDFTPELERRLRGYRATLNATETDLLGAYLPDESNAPYADAHRPYAVWLPTSNTGGRSHGVGPQILHLPPDLRLSLVSHHALRVNTDGSYQPAGLRGNAEAYTYSGADPLFFANGVLHSGVPVPGVTLGADFQEMTVLPADGLKVRRVRLGMDPLGARLKNPLRAPQDDHLRGLSNLTGAPCVDLTLFAQGPVPPYAARTNYPGTPCPPIGRGDHNDGYDAKFALRVSLDAANPEVYVNPPVLAVVRELGTGRALTVTTYWHNFYGQVDGRPTLSARMVWGANRAPLELASDPDPAVAATLAAARRDAAAPAHFQHALPVDSAEVDSPEFLHDQDWDWFAFSGENRAGSKVSLTADDLDGHVAVFSGPYSHLSPDDPENVSASGLGGDVLQGMCGIEPGSSGYLRARFAAPPIQLAALDLPPGLAWPRPGREYGTNDLDKRIAGAFVPDPRNPRVARRLSPFTHIISQGGTLAFAANPQNIPKIQSRVGRGLTTGEYEEATPQSGNPYRVRARPRNIPVNRAAKARTMDANAPIAEKELVPGDPPTRTEVYSELYVFMDRPFNPEYMGGRQSFVIGPEFVVEGAAAVVPPFASPRDKTAADLMTQRSRMMERLFGMRPLPESYAATLAAGNPECAGMDPCPAMWTNSDWAPILGGVVVMEAAKMQITDRTFAKSVTAGVYFIQPQPEMVVQLADGNTATLLAGSIIYPYSGKVIPAEAPGEDAELVVSDRHAVAAVDVSPAIAPPPVRIFREKTHRSRHFDPAVVTVARLIPKRASFHAVINVENRLFRDGRPFVENDSCPAFIQGIPAPGEGNAFPNVAAATAAFDSGVVVTTHVVFANNEAGIPKARYPVAITMTSRVEKTNSDADFENMVFSHSFGSDIVAVEQIIAREKTGRGLVFLDPAEAGVTVVIGANGGVTVNASLNIHSMDEPLRPFSLLDIANPNNSNLNIGALNARQASDNPEALFFLRVRLRKDLCLGIVPPGSFSDGSNVPEILGNVDVGVAYNEGINTDTGEGGRIPPANYTGSGHIGYLAITVTISNADRLTLAPYTYRHQNASYLGFNDETDAQIIARGEISPTIQAGDAQLVAMQAACPNCVFTPQAPASSMLEINVPVGSRILEQIDRSSTVIHSFDFGQNNANVPDLRAAGGLAAEVSGATRMGDYFSGNLVNEYYDDGAGDSGQCGTDGGDDLACQFHHNGAIHREFLGATADGTRQTVAYTFFFNRAPGVARVDSVRVLPLDQAHMEEQARSGLVFSNNYTLAAQGTLPIGMDLDLERTALNGAANPFEASELLDSSFRITVEEVMTLGMTLAPAIADGVDADALWNDTRETLHSYVLNGVTLTTPPRLSGTALNLRNEFGVRIAVGGASAAAFQRFVTAIDARFNGNPDYFTPIAGYDSTLHADYDMTIYNLFASDAIFSGFPPQSGTQTTEGYIADVYSQISISAGNVQSRGFALEITRTGIGFEPKEGSFGLSEEFAQVTVALVPYDTSKRPAGVAEYQGEEVRVTVAVYVPVSPAAGLGSRPTLIQGVFTLDQERPPLNVGEARRFGDRHYFDELENYTVDDKDNAPGYGFVNTFYGGSIEEPYIRRETPISRHLPGGVRVAAEVGGTQIGRWNSAILGSEFHFAPTPGEISRRVLPGGLANFYAALVSAGVADYILDAVEAWHFRDSAPFDNFRSNIGSNPGLLQGAYQAIDAATGLAGLPGVLDVGDYPSQIETVIRQIPQSETELCVVEPLGFLPLFENEYDDPVFTSFLSGRTVTAQVAPVAYLRWHESDSESRGYYPGRFEVLGGNINEVKRYDGSFTRGFLATPRVAEILGEYYGGGGGWRGAADLPSGGRFANGGGVLNVRGPVRGMTGTLGLVAVDGVGEATQGNWTLDLYPGDGDLQGNEHLRLRNPLSYLWQSRRTDSRHMELVGARRINVNRAHEMVRQKICRAAGGSARLREGVPQSWCLDNQVTVGVAEDSPYDFLPNLPMSAMPSADVLSSRFGAFIPRAEMMMMGMMGMMVTVNVDFDAPRVRTPFAPVGVELNSGAARDGARPIQALRLPHAIRTPVLSRIRMPAGGLGYPSSSEGFYEFPAGSRAMMMHMDASSWESIHPGLSATRGGMTYEHINAAPGGAAGTIAWAPAPLSGADNVPGEAFSDYDISGRRFLHYQRSESSPAEEPTSARQIYANAWIRLGSPGVMERNGARTRLEQGTVLNPIAGTYVSAPREGLRGDPKAVLPYATRARSTGSTPLRLLRPALILPEGSKLVVRQSARIRKVRAAVMISPAPLPETNCPSGIGGTVDQTLKDSGLLLADGTEFSSGHPCAWLDDRENLDGDRIFIYRSRPRWNATNTRVETNDQMVLLGGELEF